VKGGKTFKEFEEKFIKRIQESGLIADPQVRAQIANLAVEVLKNLEAEGRLELPKTAECSPELLSAVEAAVAKVAAELQRELERKMDKVKEEIGAKIENAEETSTLVLAEVIGKAGGEVKARIELAKDEIRSEIKEAKDEIIREQQDLAYLNSRTF
jgi:gas vesicle protein